MNLRFSVGSTQRHIDWNQIAANRQMVQKIEAEHYVISVVPLFLLLQHLTHHFVALHSYGGIDLTKGIFFIRIEL